jgi:hypothetical protein
MAKIGELWYVASAGMLGVPVGVLFGFSALPCWDAITVVSGVTSDVSDSDGSDTSGMNGVWGLPAARSDPGLHGGGSPPGPGATFV